MKILIGVDARAGPSAFFGQMGTGMIPLIMAAAKTNGIGMVHNDPLPTPEELFAIFITAEKKAMAHCTMAAGADGEVNQPLKTDTLLTPQKKSQTNMAASTALNTEAKANENPKLPGTRGPLYLKLPSCLVGDTTICAIANEKQNGTGAVVNTSSADFGFA